MADSVSTVSLFSGQKRAAFVFNNLSDGTGESAVTKVDISTLVGAPSKVKITRISGNTVGMAVRVLFDHTTDDTALILQGEFCLDFTPWGGLRDPASAGGTGDILFTTVGHSSNDSYCICMEVEPA